jgi:L-ascorbate metabolism protein UlaG (beta-lactamase superfamily)
VLSDGRVILIDPWLKDNPACPDVHKQQTRCDYVALTHAHADHCADVPSLLETHDPQVVAMYDFVQLLQAEHSKGRFTGVGIGGTCTIDGISFSMTRAFHASSYQRGDAFHYAGMPAGFVIQVPGHATVYHAGDTDVFSDMQLIHKLWNPAIVILPIGDHFTMGPAGAALAAGFFEAAAIVPMHYGTFQLLTGTVDAFKSALDPSNANRVLEMKPGDTRTWTAEGLD